MGASGYKVVHIVPVQNLGCRRVYRRDRRFGSGHNRGQPWGSRVDHGLGQSKWTQPNKRVLWTRLRRQYNCGFGGSGDDVYGV